MVQNKRKERKVLLLSALLASGLMLVIYAALRIFPFGDGTVLTGDLNGQYINYFSHYKRAFLGEAGFAYGFDKSIGGGLLGLFAYYVSSPLNLLYLLVPVSAFAQMASLVLFIKTIFACLAFCFFILRKYPALQEKAALLSLCYGFMGYWFIFAQNIMWHDVLVLLPLACYGIDQILSGKSFFVYTISLALAIFANFYIAYMACIFLAIYFVYSLFLQRGLAGKQRLKLTGKFILASLLAAGLCMMLLLPALADVGRSKGGLLNYSFSFEQNFPLWQLPYRLVFGNFFLHDIGATGQFPQLYCGMLALVLTGCYFSSGKISVKEKIFSGGILAFFILSFWVKGLDILWHGLKAPIWFPFRYSFLFSFFLLFLGGTVLARGGAGKKQLAISGGVVSLVYLVMLVFPVGVSRKKILLTLLMVLGVTFCLWAMQFFKKRWMGRAAVGILALAILVEMGGYGFYISNSFEKYSLSTYKAFVRDVGATVQAIKEANPVGKRMEKTFWRSLNDPMLFGYWGVSHFGSTQDNHSVDALSALGYRNLGSYICGSTAFADSLLSLEYLFDDGKGQVPAHYEKTGKDTPYEVYQNPFVFPMQFVVQDENSKPQEPLQTDNPFLYQNEMYTALGGNGILFEQAEQVSAKAASGEEISFQEAHFPGTYYEVTAQEQGYYYVVAKSANGWLYDLTMEIQNKPAGSYFSADNGGTIQLGYLKKGEKVTLRWFFGEGTNHPDVPEVWLEEFWVYHMDEKNLEDLQHKVTAAAGEFFVRDGDIQGSVNSQKDGQLLFLSVPFDANWKAQINGKDVQPEIFMGHFMAVPLEQGENSIMLTYKPPYFSAGLAISIFSALCVGGWLVAEKRSKRKQAKHHQERITK